MELPTKITIDALESCIHGVVYHLLQNTASDVVPPVTVCHVMLKNGKSVVGVNYGAIDPNLHSEEQGKEYAYKQAIDKLFELEGYSLINEHYKEGTGLLVTNEDV